MTWLNMPEAPVEPEPEAEEWTYESALAEGNRYHELARLTAEEQDWKKWVSTAIATTSRLELANYFQTRALSFYQLAGLLKSSE